MERLLELCSQNDVLAASTECDVYMIHQGDAAQRQAAQLAEALRDRGMRVIVHAGSSGFKSQFKRADQSGAVVAVILGENELAQREASVTWLRATADSTEQQQSIPFAELPNVLHNKVKTYGL